MHDEDNRLWASEFWDAGEMGCGELILKLKVRFQKMPADGVLQLTALDHGAIEDIPAWCRLTGHRLIHAQHPHYWIGRNAE